MSVITVLLCLAVPLNNVWHIDIGGMNATELADIKSLGATIVDGSEREFLGSFSVKFLVPYLQQNALLPPIRDATPVLSRIRSWGYEISHFDNNVQASDNRISIHSWLLQKEADIIYIPPRPIITTTTTANTKTTPDFTKETESTEQEPWTTTMTVSESTPEKQDDSGAYVAQPLNKFLIIGISIYSIYTCMLMRN